MGNNEQTNLHAEVIRSPTLSVIDQFLSRDYHQTHYEQVAQRAKYLIDEKLNLESPDGQKVQAKVTCRAKENKSLGEKLRVRNLSRNYKTSDDIWADIPDLAGVRIILYTPNDEQRRRVKEKIESIWNDVKLIQHKGTDSVPAIDHVVEIECNKSKMVDNEVPVRPSEEVGPPRLSRRTRKPADKYKPKHLGYEADHYRTTMKASQEGFTGTGSYKWRETDKVEIQVMSALTHAWAEAGHDVWYKQKAFGIPTTEEQRILDSLRGLVSSGDLLLEQFYESVNKRTYARILHRDEFGTFLRNIDILQINDEDEEDESGCDPQTETPNTRYQMDFKSEGVDILFDFLVKKNKNYPLAVRRALEELGYPDNPSNKFSKIMASFEPRFTPPKGFLAPFCLIHQMLGDFTTLKEPETAYSPSRQCLIIVNALTLLQTFAGKVETADEYLAASLDMTKEKRDGFQFVLKDPQRWNFLLRGKEKNITPGHEAKLLSAWNWFQEQAIQAKSVCGMLFRVAQLGVTQDPDLESLVRRLQIQLL